MNLECNGAFIRAVIALGLAAPASIPLVSTATAAVDCVLPPVLSAPIVYDGLCPGDAGFPSEVNARGRDVYVKLPTSKTCSKYLSIGYARNVRISGGQFLYNDSKDAVITVKLTSGTSFIDGMYIDVNKRYADAIRVNNHKGRMIIENTYIKGTGGTLNGIHGDLMHAQGGGPLQELTLQNVTGMTGYQGLFTPYRPGSGDGTRKLKVDRVNVSYDPSFSKSSGAGKPLILLYMGSADNSVDRVPDLGTTLSNVYVDGSYWQFPYTSAVYAKPVPGASGCATFDARNKIAGQACGGRPAQGDFAPADKVGRSYDRAYFCKQ